LHLAYLYRQINDKKVKETIDFLLNREEAHNAMFRDAFNKVQNSGSNRDFGSTKAAKMYFSMLPSHLPKGIVLLYDLGITDVLVYVFLLLQCCKNYVRRACEKRYGKWELLFGK
jgi:rubrerythrin